MGSNEYKLSSMLENATSFGVTVAPFGSWRSPIDSDLIATDTIRLVDVLVDGEDIYWRFVLVKHVGGRHGS